MKDDFRIPMVIRDPHAFGRAQKAMAEGRRRRKRLRRAEKRAWKEQNETMRRAMGRKITADNG